MTEADFCFLFTFVFVMRAIKNPPHYCGGFCSPSW